MCSLTSKGIYFFIKWRVFGPSVGRISGESEGVVKLLIEFSEATDMADGSRSGVYRALLAGGVYHQWLWEVYSKTDNKISFKGIIEAVINHPVVVLQF